MDEVPSTRRVTIRPPDAPNPPAEHGNATSGPVVYWCRSRRRIQGNLALIHAIRAANEAGVGLWILETARLDRPYACDRFDSWIEQSMADDRDEARRLGIPYRAAFVDEAGETDLLARCGASVVVTDHDVMRPIQALRGLASHLVAVDDHGLMPLSQTPRTWPAAVHFRRFLMRHLADHLLWPEPLARGCVDGADPEIEDIPRATAEELSTRGPGPVALRGGARTAAQRWQSFLPRLDHYGESSHPDADAVSGLSPYLHAGNLSTRDMVKDILAREDWHPGRIQDTRGSRGWWGVSDAAEAFLDQLVTWRELGAVDRFHRPDNHLYASQPDWAKATLAAHAGDERQTYPLATLEAADTDDEVWNAAQRQLLEDGIIHNHLRMLWGKRILAWSGTPEEAWDRCFHLNETYAVDGRDPNSISGIAWVFGRFDRAWQERDVYGKVRTMSSDRTRKKLRMNAYLARYAKSNDSGA